MLSRPPRSPSRDREDFTAVGPYQHQRGARLLAPSAHIEFAEGIRENTVPEVKLTRSRDGKRGMASFFFPSPAILQGDTAAMVTGMFLVDDEGVCTVAARQCFASTRTRM
mmetsp:Transcript_38891/g.63287  ORF Transcript_38891/g.63287 Transcript_38891/m.63287 type:complete len:110 (-) Transcript_38891:960-1289(-)